MTDAAATPADGTAERLDPRVQVVWAGGAAASAGVFFAVLWAVNRFLYPIDGRAPVAVAAAVALLGILLALARYRVWRFELQADALFLERGVFTRVETAVPYVRVQHIDTHRGPIERLVGLSSVVVYTAGSRGADVTVPGLGPDRARRLRDRLRELAVESEPGDAV